MRRLYLSTFSPVSARSHGEAGECFYVDENLDIVENEVGEMLGLFLINRRVETISVYLGS